MTPSDRLHPFSPYALLLPFVVLMPAWQVFLLGYEGDLGYPVLVMLDPVTEYLIVSSEDIWQI